MQQQAHTVNVATLVQQYLQSGGCITVARTKRARGVAYFAFSSKCSKHAGKANYMRGNKRKA